MAITTVAVAWLRPEDWPRWQVIAPDPSLTLYFEWLVTANEAIAELQKKGVRVEKITVDPDVFADWCRANGKRIRRQSRAAYAAAELAKRGRSR